MGPLHSCSQVLLPKTALPKLANTLNTTGSDAEKHRLTELGAGASETSPLRAGLPHRGREGSPGLPAVNSRWDDARSQMVQWEQGGREVAQSGPGAQITA